MAGGFIGIKMEPGTHEVEMSFFPAGMPLGIVLTIAGIGLVVVFFMIDNNKKGFKFMKKEKTPAPAPASTNA